MPAATTKTNLLAIQQKEFLKLEKLLSDIDDKLAAHPFEDGITIKDTIGHRAHWIALFLGWYADGQLGKEVFFPAKGYKWNDLKAYNAALRKEQAGMSWSEVQVLLKNNHVKLTEFLTGLDEADLYSGPMKGANNKWTTGRWAEAAGASHYRSAAKFLRQCMRQVGKSVLHFI